MFGFFKNKNKDKDKDKDKQCDGGGAPKDKKREKVTREEKNKEQRDSTGRKAKEDKASKSIFRKSRSIEGFKEEGGGGGGEKEEETSSSGSSGESKKSKTLDGRRSGGDWQQKQEEGERGPSAPKGSDNVDTPPPPLQPVAQSPRGSDGEGRGGQSGREGGQGEEEERKGEKRGGTEGTESKDEGIEKGQKEAREGKSEGTAPALYVRPTWRSPSTKPASAVESLVASRYGGYSRLGGTPGSTPWSTPGGTLSGTLGGSVQGSYLGSWRSDKTAATTKPPLNPRGTLSPKGPLAAPASPPAGAVVPEVVTTDRDDTSSPSPSPVVVTPPASPGLPGWAGGGGGGGVPERPVSPDGRASMLSTPSSSTSSLSSLAPARPISPSGRRTPPGPRMGTAGRLSSSPTPARKAQRPNIKTNPAAAGRRAGSRSPVGAVASSTGPSGAPDGEKLATPPPSPSSVRHQASDPCVKAPASPPPVLRARTTVTPPSPEAARKQSVFPKLVPPSSPPLRASSTFSSHISPPPDARLAQRSVSPPNLAAGGKSRHSIVSMHSLESIPELDSDGHTSAADTLERKGAKVAAGTACGQAASPSSRHSAPETAFPERHVPMGGVTGHKRSTSLTPVHEEKLSHSAKAPQVNLKAQVATAPPRSRADEDFKLASGAPEARTQQEAAKKDAKRAAPEDDKSIQHVRIEGKVAKDTRADLSAGWNRPTSPIETIEASETTTHVVIRIPLRRSASSGVIGEEKRVSIEFLPEQEKGSGRRMRSVSTPREVTREAICDSFRDPKDSIGLARNRSLTGRRESRAEGKKDDSSDNGGRVRVRRRSSSRRRRDVISPGPAVEPKPPPPAPAQDANDGGDADDDSDPNVVIIPWRRRTRSRSRVSEARTDGSAAPAASSPDPAAGAATAAGSRGRSLSSERSPGQQGRPTVAPAASEDPKAKEAAEGQVRPPPRQRSLSRGPDRRTTRAVTPADVQQANSAQDPTNDEGAPRRRRTQSSSRVPSSTANGTDAAGTGGSQRPSRRRSSSGTRQPATLPSAPKPGDKKEEEQKPAAKESTEEKTTTTASDARETTTAEHKNLPDEGSATGPPRRLEREGSAKGPIKKRSVLIQTHVIKSASRSCQADLEAPEKRALDQCKQELAAQEERYQKQVDQLTISLAEKQQELSRLTQQLEEVKRTYVDPVAMQRKMDEMQLEVREQVGQAESLKVELQYSKNEVELHKMRLQRLEEDLEAAKEKNQSLQTQLAAENKSDRIEELELRLRVMDERLRAGQQDKEKLNKQILEMEAERDEEIKIIQDALDEAAAEREELIATFEKELQNMTTMNSTREQQLMEDFEWKLREMEKDHKKKLEERERKAESTLVRAKRHQEEAEAEFRQKQEKMKNELNAEWEDKLRSECSRLKGELDGLHAEEKHLAVESMKVQKEQEIRALKQSWELRQEEMTKEISTLKDSLTEKDAYYHKEMENMRTIADRDIWELRRKYQKLDEKSWSQMETLQEKHREEMDRLREEHEERVKELEARLNAATCQLPDDDARVQMEKMYKEQVEHLTEQQTLSMERLREELEAEKFRAVEEARVLVSKHLEYVNATLREQLTEAVTSNNIYRQESEAMRMALQRREEVIQSLEEDMAKLKAEYGLNKSPSHPHYMASQSSLASSNDSSSTSSSNSQDRVSLSESIGASAEEEAPKSGGSGLLGKVFGGGWFSSSKAKETPRRGSAPSTGNQSKTST